MSTLFISHSSKDNEVAKQLAQILKAKHHESVFLDLDPELGIVAGNSWERTLYTKLRACQAVIALCTDHYLDSNWCFAEIALARMEGKHIFTLLVEPWSGRTSLPSILTEDQYIDLRTWSQHLDQQTTSEEDEGFRRLWEGFRVAGIEPAAARKWNRNDPPYPGLMSFREDQADIFFGRDKEIRQGVELLNGLHRQNHPRLAMVLGASGSGKSSLALAGMVLLLRKNTSHWLIVEPFRPTEHPDAVLAQALHKTFKELGQDRPIESIRARLSHAMERDVTTQDDRLASDPGPDSGFLGVVHGFAQQLPWDARSAFLEAASGLDQQLSRATNANMRTAIQRLLAAATAQPDSSASLEAAGNGTPSGSVLADIATDLRLRSFRLDARVLLIIDQFEELLGYDHDPDHAANRFLTLLRAGLEANGSPLLVLGTMRTDFLEALQRCKALQGFDFQSLSLGPMAESGMKQVIEEPAKLGAIKLEDGLSEQLLKDTGTPDALPLLAFTLREMWDRYRDDRLLDLSEYKELGGLHGAIANVADEALKAALGHSKQRREDLMKALRHAFMSMARLTEGGVSYARQPVLWRQFDGQGVQPILEEFVKKRLLIRREDDIEVAHEALFRSWNQLADWLDEDREFQLWRRRLDVVHEHWKENHKHSDDLLTGSLLVEALRWLDERGEALEDQQDFITQSKFKEELARAQVTAENIFSRFSTEDSLGNEEREALRELAAADHIVCTAVLEKCLASPPAAARFIHRSPYILHAILGLNPEKHIQCIREVLSHRNWAEDMGLKQLLEADGILIRQLKTADGLFGGFVDKLIQAMEHTAGYEIHTGSERLASLASAFSSLGERVGEADVGRAANTLIEAMEHAHDSDQLESLVSALSSLGERVGEADVDRVVNTLIQAIGHTASSKLVSLARAFSSLGERVVHQLANKLIQAMEHTHSSDQLASLARAFSSLGERVGEADVDRVANTLIQAMEHMHNRGAHLESLASALSSLGERVGKADVGRAVNTLIQAMEHTHSSYELESLASAFSSLALDEPYLAYNERIMNKLIQAMEHTAYSDQWNSLVRAFSSLGERVGEADVGRAANTLIQAIEHTNDSDWLRWLVRAFSSLGERVGKADVDRVANTLIQAMGHTHNSDQLESLARAFSSLGERVGEADVGRAANTLIQDMEHTASYEIHTGSERLARLARAFSSLGERVGEANVDRVANTLIQAMEHMHDRGFHLESLASALSSLGERVGEANVGRAANTLIQAMELNTAGYETSTDSQLLASLARAFSSLGERVGEVDVDRVANTLIQAMEHAYDRYELESLVSAFSSLGERAGEADVGRATNTLIQAIEHKDISFDPASLASTLSSFGGRVGAADAHQLVNTLIEAMEHSNDSDLLRLLATILSSLNIGIIGRQLYAFIEKRDCPCEAPEVIIQKLAEQIDEDISLITECRYKLSEYEYDLPEYELNRWQFVAWAVAQPWAVASDA